MIDPEVTEQPRACMLVVKRGKRGCLHTEVLGTEAKHRRLDPLASTVSIVVPVQLSCKVVCHLQGPTVNSNTQLQQLATVHLSRSRGVKDCVPRATQTIRRHTMHQGEGITHATVGTNLHPTQHTYNVQLAKCADHAREATEDDVARGTEGMVRRGRQVGLLCCKFQVALARRITCCIHTAVVASNMRHDDMVIRMKHQSTGHGPRRIRMDP